MAGNFFSTAQNIRLEDRHILRASLQRVDGEWQEAEIDLNQFIGNDNGKHTGRAPRPTPTPVETLFLTLSSVFRPLPVGQRWYVMNQPTPAPPCRTASSCPVLPAIPS